MIWKGFEQDGFSVSKKPSLGANSPASKLEISPKLHLQAPSPPSICPLVQWWWEICPNRTSSSSIPEMWEPIPTGIACTLFIFLILGVLVLFSHTTWDTNRAEGHAWLSPMQFSVWCSSDSPSFQNQTMMSWCQLNVCCQNAELQTQALLFMHQEVKHPSAIVTWKRCLLWLCLVMCVHHPATAGQACLLQLLLWLLSPLLQAWVIESQLTLASQGRGLSVDGVLLLSLLQVLYHAKVPIKPADISQYILTPSSQDSASAMLQVPPLLPPGFQQ